MTNFYFGSAVIGTITQPNLKEYFSSKWISGGTSGPSGRTIGSETTGGGEEGGNVLSGPTGGNTGPVDG